MEFESNAAKKNRLACQHTFTPYLVYSFLNWFLFLQAANHRFEGPSVLDNPNWICDGDAAHFHIRHNYGG